MATAWKDFVQGWRLFVKQPAFAWAAVATLALAIGANTLIFSIANVLLLKPLPIANPDRLGWIFATGPQAPQDRGSVSLPEYAAYRDEARAFAQLAAWRRQPVTLRVGDASERVLSQTVVGDLHAVWGLAAHRGRTLASADEAASAPKVTVLSHRFWTTRFAAREDVVGQQVQINGEWHTVVGVLTPDIELGNLSEIDVWLPYGGDATLAPRGERVWRPVGLLREGASLAEASAQVEAIARRLADEYPDTNRDWRARVGSTQDALANANTWLSLAMLGAVVGLLLLLACANVMNLLIARLIGRRQELAVRTALGATRARVVRQIVTESLLIGLVGGAAALAITAGGLQVMHAVASEPIFHQLHIDVRVVAFAIGLAFAAPLAFSIPPALRILREDVRASLGDATARSVGGRAASRGRSALVVVQVALAVMLLVVAGLIVQSVQAVVRANLGYDPSPLLTTEIEIPSWKIPEEDRALQLRQGLLDRVRALPGVEAATLTTELPAFHSSRSISFDVAGRADARDRPSAGLTIVSTGYFDTFGIPIVRGRGFDAADASSNRAVVVVSQETARRYWPDPGQVPGAVIQASVAEGAPPLEATVIGVAADTANPDLGLTPRPQLFVLDAHIPSRSTHVVLRAAQPAALAPALRAAIRDVDADLPLYRLRTMEAAFAEEHSSNYLLSGLFASFALVAVLLATAGLYGVMSYTVSQRAPEIAVRIALGASSPGIARQVVGHAIGLAGVGIGAGVIGALGLARAMASLLFGITAGDPPTYIGVVTLTLAATLLASWLPMRRAAQIDPIRNLRQL